MFNKHTTFCNIYIKYVLYGHSLFEAELYKEDVPDVGDQIYYPIPLYMLVEVTTYPGGAKPTPLVEEKTSIQVHFVIHECDGTGCGRTTAFRSGS